MDKLINFSLPTGRNTFVWKKFEREREKNWSEENMFSLRRWKLSLTVDGCRERHSKKMGNVKIPFRRKIKDFFLIILLYLPFFFYLLFVNVLLMLKNRWIFAFENFLKQKNLMNFFMDLLFCFSFFKQLLNTTLMYLLNWKYKKFDNSLSKV